MAHWCVHFSGGARMMCCPDIRAGHSPGIDRRIPGYLNLEMRAGSVAQGGTPLMVRRSQIRGVRHTMHLAGLPAWGSADLRTFPDMMNVQWWLTRSEERRHHPSRRRVRGGFSPHFPFHRIRPDSGGFGTICRISVHRWGMDGKLKDGVAIIKAWKRNR